MRTRIAASARAERQRWEGDADWQPAREAIERLLVAFDWDQAFVGLNLVVKPVADELFLKAFADLAREHGDELDALIAENLYLDAQRSRRWTVDACKAMVEADAGNAERAARTPRAVAPARREDHRVGQPTAGTPRARHQGVGHRRSCLDRVVRVPRGHRPRRARLGYRSSTAMNPSTAARAGRGACVRLDPDGRSFHCAPGTDVLAAALAAGIDLPYECASGSCGTCRARLLDGSRARAVGRRAGLERARPAQGRPHPVLPERRAGRLRDPGATWALQPAGAAAVRGRRECTACGALNRDVVHLVLEADAAVDFLPGQFMLFELPGGIGRRAYSMSNLPEAGGRLEFIVKRKPAGGRAPFIFERLASIGDRLDLEGPYGRAWLRDEGCARHRACWQAVRASRPIWSIAQAALRRSPKRRLRLYFGVNRGEDLFWLDEIEQARRAHPGARGDTWC